MAASERLMVQVAIIGAAFLILLIVGFVFARFMRRRLDRATTRADFTLQDLRSLRDSGQISEREFERMRAGLLGKAAGAPRTTVPDRKPPPPPTGGA